MEAYVSAQVLNHVISFGKQDEWLGPAQGGAFAYSNNAENIYAFHIDRIEPLHVPGLSRFTGPFRYEFLIGPLRGHIYPIDSMGPCGEDQLPSHGEPRIRLRAHYHLGRQRSRAGQHPYVFEGVLQLNGAYTSGKVQH